jgi:hypothetical protein
MMLLDQFIAQTGKQPSDWTDQDIQKYLDYLKDHLTKIAASKSSSMRNRGRLE